MPRKARSRSLSSTSPATLPNSIPTNRYGTMPKLGWRSGLSRLKRSSKRHCSRSYCLFSVQPDSYSHSSNSQRLSTPQVRSSADTCATVDMKEHPYRLEGNVLIIDFEDPTLGVQRKRILRLTDDELEFKDEEYGLTEVLRKMKDVR